MDYLKRGIKDTYNAIKENKILFLILFLLQITLIVIISIITVKYHYNILSDTQNIIGPLENINYNITDPEQVEPIFNQIQSISNSYESMLKNVMYYLIWLSGVFLIINSTLWLISIKILSKKDNNYPFNIKQVSYSWLKYFGSTLTLFIPLIIITYLLLNYFIKKDTDLTTFESIVKIISYIWLLFYVILLVSFAFLRTQNLKEFIKKIRICLTKKIYYTLLVLSINLVIITLSIYLLYLSITYQYLSLIIFSTIFLILTIIISRIFWISTLNYLDKL